MRRALLPLLLLLAACTERRSAVIARCQADMDDLRDRISHAASGLPRRSAPTARASLTPPPAYARSGADSNAAFITLEEAVGGKIAPFDLQLPSDLLSCLRWTGTAPMADAALAERDPEFAAKFARAKATKYLVVICSQLADVQVSATTYMGGDLVVTAVVIELTTGAVKAIAQVAALPPEEVIANAESARRTIIALIWKDARNRLGSVLDQATGGSFQL